MKINLICQLITAFLAVDQSRATLNTIRDIIARLADDEQKVVRHRCGL